MESYVDNILGELDPPKAPEEPIMYTQREVGIMMMLCEALPSKDAKVFFPVSHDGMKVKATPDFMWAAAIEMMVGLGRLRFEVE